MKSLFVCILLFSFNAYSGPTLNNFADHNAVFDTVDQSETVSLFQNDGTTTYDGGYDQHKLSLIDYSGKTYAFTRTTVGVPNDYPPFPGETVEGNKGRYQVDILESFNNGQSFKRVGTIDFAHNETVAHPNFKNWNLYDVHVAYNPDKNNFMITMECANPDFSASVCVAESNTPNDLNSWSSPVRLIAGGATPLPYFENNKLYLKYTYVDDGAHPWVEGIEKTYTKVVVLDSLPTSTFTTYLGTSDQVGQMMIDAVANPFCQNGWDCNNRDVSDLVKEGSRYFAVYNGGNYHRCDRQVHEAGTSDWHIGMRVSNSVAGTYEDLFGPILSAQRQDTCGISYGTLKTIGGNVYLYYAVDSVSNPKTRIHKRALLKAETWQYRVAPMCSVLMPVRALMLTPTDVDNRIRNIYCMLYERDPLQAEVDTVKTWNTHFKDLVYAMAGSNEFQYKWNSLGRNPNQQVWMVFNRLLKRAPSPYEEQIFAYHLVYSGWSYMTLVNHILNNSTASPEFNAAWNGWEF